MRRSRRRLTIRWVRCFLAFLSLLVAIPGARPAHAQEMQFNQSELVRGLLGKVVNITARVDASAPDPIGPQSAAAPGSQEKLQLGSGFVIDPSGVIVTNTHVIDGSYEIVATFADGDQLRAHVIAADRVSDVALLKVDAPKPLPAVTWGDSSKVQIGDPVLAIGNPLGVGMSVSGGIVSALNRNIMATMVDDYIQIDASINHGNSGGPLFDMRGEVVGINTAIISPTAGSAGLGFAIPANDARFVIGRLQKYGWLRPGWLGLTVQQVTPEIASALGIESPHGAIVANVDDGSPADTAGMQVGDIILRYNDKTPSDERALLRAIAETPPGQVVTLSVERGGAALDLHATIGEWPRDLWQGAYKPVMPVQKKSAIAPDMGVKVAPLLDAQRAKLGMGEDDLGVLVTAVATGTDAAWNGLKAGDAIQRVQNEPVGSPADFYAALIKARALHHDYVLLLIFSQSQARPGPEWIALRSPPQ